MLVAISGMNGFDCDSLSVNHQMEASDMLVVLKLDRLAVHLSLLSIRISGLSEQHYSIGLFFN